MGTSVSQNVTKSNYESVRLIKKSAKPGIAQTNSELAPSYKDWFDKLQKDALAAHARCAWSEAAEKLLQLITESTNRDSFSQHPHWFHFDDHWRRDRRLELAQCHLELGNLSIALKTLAMTDAVRVNEWHTVTPGLLTAEAMRRLRQPTHAIARCNAMLNMPRKWIKNDLLAAAYFVRARAYNDLSLTDAARADFQKASGAATDPEIVARSVAAMQNAMQNPVYNSESDSKCSTIVRTVTSPVYLVNDVVGRDESTRMQFSQSSAASVATTAAETILRTEPSGHVQPDASTPVSTALVAPPAVPATWPGTGARNRSLASGHGSITFPL
jgi:hypothetical protein